MRESRHRELGVHIAQNLHVVVLVQLCAVRNDDGNENDQQVLGNEFDPTHALQFSDQNISAMPRDNRNHV